MYKLSKTVSLILSVTVLAVSMLGVQAAEEKKRNNPFADTYDKWYETSVDYTYGKGLVSGFDDGTFKPDATISRAEFSVILERLFNRETVTAVGSEWYSQAEAWIKANDIMAEIIQNDEFEPSKPLAREELTVMLYNSYKLNNTVAQTDVKLEEFEDGSDVSEYAQEAVEWFISNGIINGDDKNKINPANNVTRGETTAIMQRFVNSSGAIVSIDSVNGDDVQSFYVSKGTKLKKPNDPTRAKFVFVGWYSGDKVWNFETPINEDVSINAKWATDENTNLKEENVMEKVKIVTWNIRYAWDKDGVNSFIHRVGMINEKLIAEKPDVVAFQEVNKRILRVMQQLMSEYTFVGHFRNENYTGEGVFVAIRKDTFDLIGTETIWLSPTPYVSGSVFENQSPRPPRVCTMAQIMHKKTGKLMRIYDVHLDYSSEETRVLEMECLFDFIEQYNAKLELPSVILGDFNTEYGGEVVEMCNNYEGIKDVTKDIAVTYHAFGTEVTKIDYIYLPDEFVSRLEKVEAWTDEHAGIFLSDHYPICAEFGM